MENNELKKYILECKRIGLNNVQIAMKLGMDEYVFEDTCKFLFEGGEPVKKETKVLTEKEKEVLAKPRKEKVEGIFYVPQNSDDENIDS